MTIKDPEKRRKWAREYYAKNRVRILALMKESRKGNRPKQRNEKQLKWHREYMRQYLREHPEYRERQNRLRYQRAISDILGTRKRIRTWHQDKKAELFSLLGNKCTCCGERTKEFLSLDHIHGGGAKHRKEVKNNVFWNGILKEGKEQIFQKYRLLCFNCNMSRGFYGFCPHDKETFDVIGIAC